MAWRGSASRSFVSAARASTFHATPAAPRIRPHLPAPPPLRPRRLPFANSRTMGELGCSQSLLPLAGAPSTSHLSIRVRASCELFHGTFCRTCQDR